LDDNRTIEDRRSQHIKKAQKVSASRRPSGAQARQAPTELAHRARGSSSKFAFPRQRKEPLTDARHVPNAIARFNQVEDVSKSERDAAWRRIKSAAKKYGIEISHKPKARSR